MAVTGSPSNSQHQHNDEEDLQNQDPNATESQEPEQSPRQQPPHSETLETLDLPNSLQSPVNDQLVQNSQQQSDKNEDTLLILDEDDQQSQQKDDYSSGTTQTTFSEPIIPHKSPVIPQRRFNKRKKGPNLLKRKFSMKKAQRLTDNLNAIPFVPAKTLYFVKHEEVLKRLGLYEFSKIEFDRSIRIDYVSQLIVNYDPKKRCSYVNEFRINVNRADLARALKLPATKEKGSSVVEEVDLDSEVFSDEMIEFIEDFVSNWMLLHEDSWVMPVDIANWTRCIKDGHPEKLDPARLIWYMVEKELTQGVKLVDCYYASHLQYLIRSQRNTLFIEDDDGVADDDDGEENVKANDHIEEKEEKDEKGEKEQKEQKEQKEEETEEKEENEVNVSIVTEHDIELTLGPEVEEIVHDDGKKDDEMMVNVEEHKEEELEEQGNWLMDGKNPLGDHFMQRCENNDLKNYEENNIEEVEDEPIEQMEVEDEQIEQLEDEDEEEEGGGRVDEEGFDMEANDDSLDRGGLTDNFLQGVETSHIPYNSHGMSSMDLFGSRDGSFMAHGGPSFFNNGGKRVMEPEEDIHHLENNKRLKTDEMWDQKPNDFGLCMEQMQQWMEKAKMIHESKEQSYENSQFNQQLAMNQLQERQHMMEIIIKSKDEELEKKHAEVFRLERELYLMGDLLQGYRKALNDTKFKFSEYRKRYALQEEPLYKDVGPGGLVLSTRELEKQRLKQEEDIVKFSMLAKNIEEDYMDQMKMHGDKVKMMVDKLVSIDNEVKRLKEISTQIKETQKDGDQKELIPEPEEKQNSLELSVDHDENQKSMELSDDHEENQKSMDEVMENNARVERAPPDDADESKELTDEHEASDQKTQNEVLPDADESKEKIDGEED